VSKFDDPDFLLYLEKFSFVCLCETFVDCFDFSRCLSMFQAFVSPAKKLSRRGRKSGGVVCLVRKSIAMYFKQLFCDYDNILAFRVSKALFNSERDILLFGVYVPPLGSPYYNAAEDTDGILLLEKCINDILVNHDDCSLMVCGDLNARTANMNTVDAGNIGDCRADVLNNSRVSYDNTVNDFGRSLLSLCLAFDLLILNGYLTGDVSGAYTFMSTNGSSVVDYFIVSKDMFSVCQSLTIVETVASPHMCMEFIVQCGWSCAGDGTQRKAPYSRIIWDDNKADVYVDNLCKALGEKEVSNLISHPDYDIHLVTDIITWCMVSAADFLRKLFVDRGSRKHSKPWYDRDCYASRKSVRRQLRKYLRTRCDTDRFLYIRYRNEYKALVKLRKQDYRCAMSYKLSNGIHDANVFWKHVRNLQGRNRVPDNIPLDVWLRYFQSVLSCPGTFSEVDMSSLTLFSQDFPDDLFILDAPIVDTEILNAIRQLKIAKAPGADNILSEMLKSSANHVLPYLINLFNTIFNKGVFPCSWEESVIIPLHKKGDYENPENYRGISLTSVFSKVYLHILNSRLQDWADENGVIYEEQAGFRKGYSTCDNMFVLHNIVRKYLNRHKKLFIAFVDFQKAFDSVNRRALWVLLERIGIGGKMLKMLKSVYGTVRCSVRCQRGDSEHFDCKNGLKQGCKLSPLLFSFLINEVAAEIKVKGKHGVQLLPNTEELFALLFADDVVLMSDTASGLQNQLDCLQKSAGKFGLTVNIHKTKIVVFRLGGPLAKHEKWYLGTEKVEVVNEYKYLGNMFSTKLCTNTVLSDLACRARASVMQIMKALRKLGHMTPDIFYKILDTQIQPMLLYGAEIWGLDDCNIIEGIHLFALKYFMNVSSRTPNMMVYGDAGRFPLHVNATMRSIKYWTRILKMDARRLPSQSYKMMLNCPNDVATWAAKVKRILQEHGFDRVWESQHVENESTFLKSLRERLIEQFCFDWESKLNASNRYRFYKQIKARCETEEYLYALDKKIFRDIYIRFRLGISDLSVHKLRYSTVEPEVLCPLCREREEDEYHFLLECPALYDLRGKFVIPFLCIPVSDAMTCLMSSTDQKVIRSVSIYLYYAFKRREEAVEIAAQDTFLLQN